MDFYNNMPGPARAATAVLTGTSILGSLYYIDYRLAAIVTAGSLLLAMVIAGYYTIRGWIQKRRAKSMVGDLQQQSTAAPSALSDLNKRAKLDDMRQKFASGLAKFGDAENVYRFPWYLIVGEPGGGKSEAIRHCNVGFPPGMQDELQGVGGTINMNWWFTNQAVFLDTAGRLMFEEVKPGETNEWKEFLALLKRNRPNCPVNGLLLVIPADSLIRDNESQLNEKAGKIAQQFDLIQRTLDIRFPVFVVITKCDLLSGFREFFDDLSDAQSQQQMLGWSNPLERDQPFQTELVTAHIDTVVERIKKRRLSLLRDPVPQKGMERRADEVDALYSFPQSLQLIAPRLRTYLEKIFVAGPWSPKPLFLRGIYFASSMREGAALDQELAQALGVSIEQIRETRSWERERAYFLRDLFTEKIFKERGLVTRATNTRKMLRTRSTILWGSGTVLALAFIAASVYGYTQLEQSIATQTRFWKAASVDWKSGIWHPIVKPPETGAPVAIYKGNETVEGDVTLVAFHDRLRQLATADFVTSWVYRPMLWWFDLGGTSKKGDRIQAQRIVFEGGVVSPLVKAARGRMLNEKIEQAEDAKNLTESERMTREARALAALVRVESDSLSATPNVARVPDDVVKPLLTYSTALAKPADDAALTSLGDTVSWTYTSNKTATWTPKWLPDGSVSLEANKPIQNGLLRLKTLADGAVKTQIQSLDLLKALRDDLRAFREKEVQMDRTVPLPELSSDDKAKRMDGLLDELSVIKAHIDERLRTAIGQHLFEGESYSISAAYQRLIADSQKAANESFDLVKREVKDRVADADHRLFKQVDDFLTEVLGHLKSEFENGFKEEERAELVQLDPFLQEYEPGRRIYEVRWVQYAAARKESAVQDDTKDLIGKNWSPLRQMRATIGQKRTQLVSLEEKLTKPFSASCRYYLDRAEEARSAAIVLAYVAQTRARFDNDFHPPLVSEPGAKAGMTAAAVKGAARTMSTWAGEINSDALKEAPASARPERLVSFVAAIAPIDIDTNLHNLGRAPQTITVTVHGYGGSPADGAGRWRGIRIGGRMIDIGAGASASATIPYGASFSARLYNFPANATEDADLSISGERLKQGGGVSETVRGSTMRISAEVHGEPPLPVRQPSKATILNTLR
jgi:hypothetical protein